MKKTILTFGLISSAISSLMMVATVPFAERIGFDKAAVVGYTAIVLSFLLVFFGIRSYRDNAGNGHITFTKAFAVGISITLISYIFYVVTGKFSISTSCMISWTNMAPMWSRRPRPRARVLQPSRRNFSK